MDSSFCRPAVGEVSALKWEDLDVENRILVIRRKVQKGKLVPSTKTKRRRRVAVAEALIKHQSGLPPLPHGPTS